MTNLVFAKQCVFFESILINIFGDFNSTQNIFKLEVQHAHDVPR